MSNSFEVLTTAFIFAKDFSEVLKNDLGIRQIMGNGHFKFTLNPEFVLNIEIITLPTKLNAPLLRV